jgi:hypothetical protein
VVPAGITKALPPKVVPLPEPVKLPEAAVAEGLIDQKAVVEPGISTRPSRRRRLSSPSTRG